MVKNIIFVLNPHIRLSGRREGRKLTGGFRGSRIQPLGFAELKKKHPLDAKIQVKGVELNPLEP
jgi:hypothetical protein